MGQMFSFFFSSSIYREGTVPCCQTVSVAGDGRGDGYLMVPWRDRCGEECFNIVGLVVPGLRQPKVR